jgi:hypothetical protein
LREVGGRGWLSLGPLQSPANTERGGSRGVGERRIRMGRKLEEVSLVVDLLCLSVFLFGIDSWFWFGFARVMTHPSNSCVGLDD